MQEEVKTQGTNQKVKKVRIEFHPGGLGTHESEIFFRQVFAILEVRGCELGGMRIQFSFKRTAYDDLELHVYPEDHGPKNRMAKMCLLKPRPKEVHEPFRLFYGHDSIIRGIIPSELDKVREVNRIKLEVTQCFLELDTKEKIETLEPLGNPAKQTHAYAGAN